VAAWIFTILFGVVGPLVVWTVVLAVFLRKSRRAEEWKKRPGPPADDLVKAIDSQTAPYAAAPIAPHASLPDRWRTDREEGPKRHRLGPLLWSGLVTLVCWLGFGVVYVGALARLSGSSAADASAIAGMGMGVIVAATVVGAVFVWWRAKRDSRERRTE
jgi:uncharacterized membrane protein YfcA